MKKISTNNMSPDTEHNLVRNLAGVLGNKNIRGCHIQYFERKVLECRENTVDDIASAPNYYAWLWLYTEHIFWTMREFCFRQGELAERDLDQEYKKLVDKFCGLCRGLGEWSDEDLNVLFGIVNKVLRLRHAFVHNGFPNLLPATLKETRRTNQAQEAIAWYSDPTNFAEIVSEFNKLRDLMSKGSGLTVDVEGLFSISCGPSRDT